MYIQVVTFHLKDLPEDAYREACEQVAPAIADVPGLISKVFLASPETNTYGGVYSWRDRPSMESYLQSDIFRGLAANPNLVGVESHAFGVFERPTEITRGLATVAA